MSCNDLVPTQHARLITPEGAREFIAAPAGITARELLAEVPEDIRAQVLVFLNGTRVADLDGVTLREGDNVLLAVVPAGGGEGGGGKAILGAILTIVIAVYAGPLATFLLSGAESGMAFNAVRAVITLVGTMAVQALVKPPPISTNTDRPAGASAASYSMQGQSNSPRLFGPCYVIYGQHRVAPLLANNIDIDNLEETSILTALYDFGLGWVQLSDERIGDVSVEEYNPERHLHQNSYCTDLTMAGMRLGYDQYAINMAQNDPAVLRTKTDTTWALLMIQFQRGLFQVSPTKGPLYFQADFQAWWRPVGGSAWTLLPIDKYKGGEVSYTIPATGLQFAIARIDENGNPWNVPEDWKDYQPTSAPLVMPQALADWRATQWGAGANPSQTPQNYALYVQSIPSSVLAFAYPNGNINESDYFARYPEIKTAGWTRTARDHFESIGSREHRDPKVRVVISGTDWTTQDYDVRTTPDALHAHDYKWWGDWWTDFGPTAVPNAAPMPQGYGGNDNRVGGWQWLRGGYVLLPTQVHPMLQWRTTNDFVFHEDVYLTRYQDVRTLVNEARVASGWAHFTQVGAWEYRDPYDPVPAGAVRIKATTTNPYYINLLFQFDVPGEYEVMVQRIDKIEDGTDHSISDVTQGRVTAQYNESTISLLKSFQKGEAVKPRLRHTMQELRVQATDQLSGVIQNYNAIATSVLAVTTDGVNFTYQPTRNPAWIALDILTSERNPRPISRAQIDWPSWLHLAQVCDMLRSYTANGQPYTGPRYTCDIVVASTMTVKDLVESVLSGCRSSLILTTAGKWGVLHDEDKTIARQLLTPANSWGFSGQRTFSQIPHALRVNFVNRDNAWQKDEVTVYADGYSVANAEVFETLDTYGITDYPHAWAYGRYMLAQGILRGETFTVSLDVENLLVQRGDMVYVAHDVPMIGGIPSRIDYIGGTGSNGGLIVHCNLELSVAVGGYCVRAETGDIYSGRVLAHNADGYFELESGMGVSLDALIVFGDWQRVTQPYLVQRVTPGQDLSAQLSLLKYDPDVYKADIGALPDWDPGWGRDYIQGTDLRDFSAIATQRLYHVNRLPFVDVVLTWSTDGFNLDHHEVAVATNDGRERVLANTKQATYRHTFDALLDGEYFSRALKFIITPVSGAGWRGVSTVVTITLVPDITAPAPVIAFGANVQKETVHLSWTPPNEPDIAHYLLRYTPEATNPQWAASQLLATIGWPDTQAHVGARTGSYGIRVRDTSGNESPVVWRRTTVAVLPDINVITILNDAQLFPDPWPGRKSHVVRDDFNIQSEGDFGAVYPLGYYYFRSVLDLGEVYEVRISSKIKAYGEVEADYMAGWLSLAALEAMAHPVTALWDAWLEVRTADDMAVMADWPDMVSIDPIGTANEDEWSAWRTCIVGDFTGRLFQFRIVLQSGNTGVRVVVTSGRTEVDMPDRVDTYGDQAVAAAGLDFVFPVAFRHLESVAITIDGNAAPVVAEVTNKSNLGMRIRLRNTTNSTYVAGQVDIMAEGYGRMRATSI